MVCRWQRGFQITAFTLESKVKVTYTTIGPTACTTSFSFRSDEGGSSFVQFAQSRPGCFLNI